MSTQTVEKAPKPENACFSDASLLCIIKELGNIGLIMQFAMNLNIPNTAVVNCKIDKDKRGLSDKDMGAALIKNWKAVKVESKDKNKAQDIEKALQSVDRGDMAEVFMECYRNQTEMTPAALQ